MINDVILETQEKERLKEAATNAGNDTAPANAEDDSPVFMWIPFVPGVSEKFSRLARNFGVTTRFSRTANLRSLLSQPKVPFRKERKSGVIYKIDCDACDKFYVGETGKCLHERMNQHDYALRSSNPIYRDTNCNSKHADEEAAKGGPAHRPQPGQPKILCHIRNTRQRRIAEGFFIAANKPQLMTGNSGAYISPNFCNSLHHFALANP